MNTLHPRIRINRPLRLLSTSAAVLSCTAVLSCFSACSYFPSMKAPANEPRVSDAVLESLEVTIFASRGSLFSQEFERYTLQRGLLFQECGLLQQERSDSARSDAIRSVPLGRFQSAAKKLDVRRLRPSEMRTIARELSVLQRELSEDSQTPLPPAQLGEAGMFELQLKAAESPSSVVLTAFDAVAEADSRRLRNLRRFYGSVRGLGKEGCGESPFFGVAAR